MGLRDWFRAKPSIRIAPVVAPSVDFPTARDGIGSILRAAAMPDVQEGWVNFTSQADGKEVCFEVFGDVVNLCLRELDLKTFLTEIGLPEIAARTRIWERDQTQWRITKPTPEELAEVVNALFLDACGEGYAVKGEYREL